MSLSTHILDTALGLPAANVPLVLYKLAAGQWHELGHGETDRDGRCNTLLGDAPLEPVIYKLHFAISEYYTAKQITGLYPFIEITFSVAHPSQHYHIPLLLTANGYTTYRGS